MRRNHGAGSETVSGLTGQADRYCRLTWHARTRPDNGRFLAPGGGRANSTAEGAGEKEEFDFVEVAGCRRAPA